MSKSKSFKPPITQRVDIPRVAKNEHGATILLCPFCQPSHPLRTDGETACGTMLRVQAVQTVYDARHAKKLVCAKCGKGGGKMVAWNGAYVHLEQCVEGVVTMTEQPKFTKVAEYVYKSPKWAKQIIEKYAGRATPVNEVSPNGERTGNVLGYFFWKGK